MEKSFFTSTAATVGGDISEWIPAVIKKKNSQKLWPLNAPRSGGFFFIPTLLICITNTQKHNYSNYLWCDDPNQVVQRKAIIIRRGSYKSFISYRGERGVWQSSTETGEDLMEVYCTLYMWCIWQTYVKWVFDSNTETWFNLYIHSMLSARPKLMNQRSICCSRQKIAVISRICHFRGEIAGLLKLSLTNQKQIFVRQTFSNCHNMLMTQ